MLPEPNTTAARSSTTATPATGEGRTHLVPAGQVCGGRSVPERSDIDDPADARLRRRPTEGGGKTEVDIAESTTGGHRMDEVIGNLDTTQGVGGRAFVAHVNSDGPRTRREGAHGTAEADHVVPGTEQLGRQSTSDKTRSPGDGNDHREPFPREEPSIAGQQPGARVAPERVIGVRLPAQGSPPKR